MAENDKGTESNGALLGAPVYEEDFKNAESNANDSVTNITHVADSEASTPIEDFEALQSIANPEVSTPVADSEVSTPVADSEVSHLIVDSEISQPISNTDASQPIVNSEVSRLIADSEVSQPAADSDTSNLISNDEVSQPIADPEVSQHIVDSKVSEPIADSEILLPVTDSEILQPVSNAEVTQHIKDSEVSQFVVDPESEILQSILNTKVSQPIADSDASQHIIDSEISQLIVGSEIQPFSNAETLQPNANSQISTTIMDSEISTVTDSISTPIATNISNAYKVDINNEDCSMEKEQNNDVNQLITDKERDQITKQWSQTNESKCSDIKNLNFTEHDANYSYKLHQDDNETLVHKTYVNICEPENFDSSDTSALMKLAELACETKESITSNDTGVFDRSVSSKINPSENGEGYNIESDTENVKNNSSCIESNKNCIKDIITEKNEDQVLGGQVETSKSMLIENASSLAPSGSEDKIVNDPDQLNRNEIVDSESKIDFTDHSDSILKNTEIEHLNENSVHIETCFVAKHKHCESLSGATKNANIIENNSNINLTQTVDAVLGNEVDSENISIDPISENHKDRHSEQVHIEETSIDNISNSPKLFSEEQNENIKNDVTQYKEADGTVINIRDTEETKEGSIDEQRKNSLNLEKESNTVDAQNTNSDSEVDLDVNNKVPLNISIIADKSTTDTPRLYFQQPTEQLNLHGNDQNCNNSKVVIDTSLFEINDTFEKEVVLDKNKLNTETVPVDSDSYIDKGKDSERSNKDLIPSFSSITNDITVEEPGSSELSAKEGETVCTMEDKEPTNVSTDSNKEAEVEGNDIESAPSPDDITVIDNSDSCRNEEREFNKVGTEVGRNNIESAPSSDDIMVADNSDSCRNEKREFNKVGTEVGRNNIESAPSSDDIMVADNSDSCRNEKRDINKVGTDNFNCPKIFVRKDLEEASSHVLNDDNVISEEQVDLSNEIKISHVRSLSKLREYRSKRPLTNKEFSSKRMHTTIVDTVSDNSSGDDEKLIIDERRSLTKIEKSKSTQHLPQQQIQKELHSELDSENVTVHNSSIELDSRNNINQSNSSLKTGGVKSTSVEVVDLVDVDSEISNQNATESTISTSTINKSSDDISEDSKNYVCNKCKEIWNDNILKLLFEGNDSVTVNSRITYGAIICMNIYVSIHYPNIKEQALIGLLDRADLAKNLGSIKVSVLNNWLVALIRSKNIKCCDPFRPVYRLKTQNKSQISDQNKKSDNKSTELKNSSSENQAKSTSVPQKSSVSEIVLDDSENIDYSETSTASTPSTATITTTTTITTQPNKEYTKKADVSSKNLSSISDTKGILTIGKIISTKHFAKFNLLSCNIIQNERESLSPEFLPIYDQLTYESKLLEEEAEVGKKKSLTNKEILCLHSIFILNAKEIRLDLYFKFLFQLLYYRECILLIPDGKTLVKAVENVRKENNRQKFSIVKNKNFLNQSWDPEFLYTAPRAKNSKNLKESQPNVRDILGTFCYWKSSKLLNTDIKPVLRDEVLKLFGNKIEIEDCFSLCVRLFSNYCRLSEQEEREVTKTKLFLSLYYLPKRYLSELSNVATFSADLSFLPPVSGNLNESLIYLENQVKNESNRAKRSHPDSLIDEKLQQTKKLRTSLMNHVVKSTKAVSLLDTYARLSNEMSYLEVENDKNENSQDSQAVFAEAFASYTPEVKIMAAKLRAANIDIETIPAILENLFRTIFKRRVPISTVS